MSVESEKRDSTWKRLNPIQMFTILIFKRMMRINIDWYLSAPTDKNIYIYKFNKKFFLLLVLEVKNSYIKKK